MRTQQLRTSFVPAGNYSSDYLEDIIRSYEANQQSLKALAEGRPLPQPRVLSCDDLEENRLHQKQDHLLELAALVEPTDLKQLHLILRLWHHVAIKEVAPQDISAADRLAIAAYTFTVSAAKVA